MPDDFLDTPATTGRVTINGTPLAGTIATINDRDWFAVGLTAGITYQFWATKRATSALRDPYLTLYNSQSVALLTDDDSAGSSNALITYTAVSSGTYYLSVQDYSTGTGRYTIAATVDDRTATTATTGRVTVNGTATNGAIEATGDRDWFAVRLISGNTYQLRATSRVTSGLSNPYLTLFDSTGHALTSNNDGGMGNNALITYVADATATYYLGVRDYGSGTGRYTVSATIPDDFAATTATTGQVTVNSATLTQGTIERASDRDWFAVTLTAGTSYLLRADSNALHGLTDPYLTLYDVNGTVIANNNNSGVGDNALIRYTPTATGTFYLGVRGYASTDKGSYTVSATSVDDYGATTTTAGPLTTDGVAAAGVIEKSGDQDWFAVTLNGGDTYRFQADRTATASGLSDPRLALYDQAGALILFDDDGGEMGNAQITYTPNTSGSYYLGVRDAERGTGQYQLTATTLTSEGVVDDFAGTIETLGIVTAGSEDGTSGIIESAWDVDLFAVTLSANVSYQLRANAATVDGLDDPYLILYDASGVTLATNDDGGPDYNSLIVYRPTTAGTYYLGVKAYGDGTGAYQVTALAADDFSANSSTTGRVRVNEEPVQGTIEQAQDKDWFSVRLTSGVAYRFQADALGSDGLDDPYLTLLDADGTVLRNNNDSGSGNNALLSYTPTTSGTYYLQARDYGNGTGRYELSATADDDATATIATTAAAVLDGQVSGAVETAQDRDWFSATLVAGQTYTIDLRGAPSDNGTLSDPYFYGVHDSTGQLIDGTSNDDYGSSRDAHTEFTPTVTGVYYLAAGGYSSQTGSYVLQVGASQSSEIAQSVNTTASLEVGGRVGSRIDSRDDEDWFRVTLEAGETYIVEQLSDSSSASPLSDPSFAGIFSESGILIADTTNDDYGLGMNSRVQYTPTVSGTYYLAAGGYGSTVGDYVLALSVRADVVDTVSDSTDTTGTIRVGTTGVTGIIDTAFDRDWYRVTLTADQNYAIDLRGANSDQGSLIDPTFVGVYDADGVLLPGTGNADANGSTDAFSTFRPSTSGTYYLSVGGNADSTGSYRLTIRSSGSTDIAANITTTASAVVGEGYQGVIDAVGDVDWIQVSLIAGATYEIGELGTSGDHGTLSDPFIQGIYDSQGLAIADTANDDFNGSRNASVTFVAPATGAFYIAAGAYGSSVGTYYLSVGPGVMDTSRPTLINAVPGTINPASNLTLTFNEPVRAGTSGDFRLTGGGQTLVIPVSSSQVTISGETITINPENELLDNTTYTLSIDSEAILDVAGNGYHEESALSFVTSSATQNDTWTVMVYIAADNNLETFAIDNLNEMEAVRLPESINVVTLLDRIPGYDNSNGNWTDTRQGAIVPDSNTSTVSSFSGFTSLGEINTGDPASLTNFINWSAANNPADHYALVVWDHGGGLSGSCWDDSNSADHLTANELRSALDNSNVDHFDLVGFDACLMGMMEQAWDLRTLTDVVVASEELIPGPGWAYTTWLQDLVNNPNMSATTLGDSIVTRYAQKNAGEGDITLSSIQTNRLADLNASLETFATQALSSGSADWENMRQAVAHTLDFGGQNSSYNYRDLGDFMDNVAGEVSDATLRSAASAVAQSLDNAVSSLSGTMAGATGLSIYLPYGSTRVSSTYTAANHSFLGSSSWENFLAAI
ncbi:MAG: DVUA0089 family protein [Magnetococcales bacterium]|nr:DVUA0089 family protein [Magnetococcales bacterium]